MFLVLFLCAVCAANRCIIFKNRDEKWWKALIPAYNKYILGKLAGEKLLGIAMAISYMTSCILMVVGYAYEISVLQEYMYTYNSNAMYVTIPADVKNMLVFLKYFIIGAYAISILVWSYMMNKFSKMHGKSNKWIILWFICPAIPYAYFALSNHIYMNGKHYILEKKEIR